MSSVNGKSDGGHFWRSLAELADDPEFIEAQSREFLAENPQELGSASRRRFMQLLGASAALASAAGCRWPKEAVLPFSQRPGEWVPGKSDHYATAMELAGVAQPLLVKSYDGRPIKADGNPDHPASQGGSSIYGQASILSLYDPDRSKKVRQAGGGEFAVREWSDFRKAFNETLTQLRASGGKAFRILSEANSSPTVARLRANLLKAFPQAQWVEYEPVSFDAEREGLRLAFGRPHRAQYDLSKAKVIAALDSDLIGTHPDWLRNARQFAQGRKPDAGEMNRLYAVEPLFSITGTSADNRLQLRSAQIKPFLLALEAKITGGEGPSGGFLSEERVAKFLDALAKDLKANAGKSIVSVGASQPADVHAITARVNAALGNVGRTVAYTEDAERPSHNEGIAKLAAEMKAGEVSTLLILGGNPVYNAPADVEFPAALEKVGTKIHHADYLDETSLKCDWHLPRTHFLEAWADSRTWDGTITLVQPLIDPLYEGRSTAEVLALALGDADPKGQELVRATHGLSAKAWKVAVQKGFIENTGWARKTPSVGNFEVAPVEAAALKGTEVPNGDLELVFRAGQGVYDGRFANNAWLQEMPEFVTKITWDNAAVMNPKTADQIGIKKDGQMVVLKVNGREMKMPAYRVPGQASGVVWVALGYGRESAGNVGGLLRDFGAQGLKYIFTDGKPVGPVGFDTYKLRTSKDAYFAGGLSVETTTEEYTLATTQDHHVIDRIGYEGREDRASMLIREMTFEKYKTDDHVDFDHMIHHPPLESLWEEWEYPRHKWGMSVDLTACIGCNSCVIACQSENNVPVVGKEQVLKGREMHWLRLDRYYGGEVDNPQVSYQPILCQHCENAPCEQVCPVGATLHSDEGLNLMVYNRCIGTRYCSNNCPWKVRRFNFFNYQKEFEEPGTETLKMMWNPEVTVRSRGVMEKCTFCVQRIEHARIEAKNENRPIRDGEIRTACQVACPTSAIVFGDLNEKDAEVTKNTEVPRAYAMLAELNNKPRLRYLGRIRNPNPELGETYR